MNDEIKPVTIEDIDKVSEIFSKTPYRHYFCTWCEKSDYVREVGPNYICYDCEKKERAALRSIVFTSSVRDSYFEIKEGISPPLSMLPSGLESDDHIPKS